MARRPLPSARALLFALASSLLVALVSCSATQGRPRLELERWGAVWCEPCQRMERESWRDPRVERWLAAHARVTSRDLDVDAELAERLGVRAIPCVVARRSGSELGRLDGYHGPEPLLSWLATMERGGTDVDAARAAADAAPGDPDALQRLARAQREDRRSVDAARTLARVWALPRGARGSLEARLVDETRLVAEADPEARDVLRARLDERSTSARGDDSALEDWIELSVAVGRSAEVARWFVECEDRAARRAPIVASREALWSALRGAGDFGALVDLVELSVRARTWATNMAEVSDFERQHFDESTLAALRAGRRERIEDLCRGLLELGRTAEAEEISRILRASELR